jgi:hypothetical protein
MRLFVVFLVLSFLAGMAGRPTASDRRLRWFIAALGVALVVGYYVFRRI